MKRILLIIGLSIFGLLGFAKIWGLIFIYFSFQQGIYATAFLAGAFSMLMVLRGARGKSTKDEVAYWVGILMLCAGLTFIAALGFFNDIVKSRYATLAEAHADQLFGRGWLPDILPASTINIVVNNNLDLNLSWGGFEIPPGDLDVFKSQLSLSSPGKYFYPENEGIKGWVFIIDDKSGHVEYAYE